MTQGKGTLGKLQVCSGKGSFARQVFQGTSRQSAIIKILWNGALQELQFQSALTPGLSELSLAFGCQEYHRVGVGELEVGQIKIS